MAPYRGSRVVSEFVLVNAPFKVNTGNKYTYPQHWAIAYVCVYRRCTTKTDFLFRFLQVQFIFFAKGMKICIYRDIVPLNTLKKTQKKKKRKGEIERKGEIVDRKEREGEKL